MATAGVEALQLPDIVTRVLHHVDTQQRITCCSLVSRTWNTAAKIATKSIHVRYLPDSKVTSLQGWLARHGNHLTSLYYIGYDSHSSDSFSLVSRLAPWLQQLQHLDLLGVRMSTTLVQHDINVLSRSLTALTAFSLHCSQVDAQAVGSLCFLSSLHRLQALKFSHEIPAAVITAADPRYLPLSLTRLQIFDYCCGLCGKQVNPRVPAITASVLPQLTNLQHLFVSVMAQGPPSVRLGASMLSCLVQLTELVYYVIGDVEWSETDTTSFLSGVCHLTRLQHLDVGNTFTAASPFIKQYSSLTSSSSLTHLILHGCRVPKDYLHHMLPFGRQFTALQVLDVGWQSVVGRQPRGTLTHIIATCPNLQRLTVSCLARESAQLKQLTQLSTLTGLTVSGQNFNRGFVPTLMQLAELRDLSLLRYVSVFGVDNELSDASGGGESDSSEAAGSLPAASLLELRHLTQVTKLHVGKGMCHEVNVPEIWLEQKPLSPVWEQLNTRLMNIPHLASLIDAEGPSKELALCPR